MACKSVIAVILGDVSFTSRASNLGNQAVFMAMSTYIFTAHAHKCLFMSFWWKSDSLTPISLECKILAIQVFFWVFLYWKKIKVCHISTSSVMNWTDPGTGNRTVDDVMVLYQATRPWLKSSNACRGVKKLGVPSRSVCACAMMELDSRQSSSEPRHRPGWLDWGKSVWFPRYGDPVSHHKMAYCVILNVC